MSIHWTKESSSSVVDAHLIVLLFEASLKAMGDLAYHAKG